LQIVRTINNEVEIIEGQLEELTKLHIKNPGVGLNKFQDEQIDNTTKIIINKIKDIQEMVSSIGKGKKLSSRENLLKDNIQTYLANLLQNHSTKLNRTQKHHLKQVSQQNERMSEFMKLEEFDSDDDKSWMYTGIKDSQIPISTLTQLDPDRELINERNQEIERITAQMHEISTIFNDLAVMVIEQGSILDRIDENIMSATQNVTQGVKALGDANKSETNYRKRLFTILAIIIIVVIIIIIIIASNK